MNFRKYLPYFVFSCKKVSAIICKDVRDRTLKESIILCYHIVICKPCVRFKSQNDWIDFELKELMKTDKKNKLSETKKQEIIKKLGLK